MFEHILQLRQEGPCTNQIESFQPVETPVDMDLEIGYRDQDIVKERSSDNGCLLENPPRLLLQTV